MPVKIWLLTISFSFDFCGAILPWLYSYMFGHSSFIPILGFSFSLSPWMWSYQGFHPLSFLFFFCVLSRKSHPQPWLFRTKSMVITTTTKKANYIALLYSELNVSKTECTFFLNHDPPLVFLILMSHTYYHSPSRERWGPFLTLLSCCIIHCLIHISTVNP